MISERYAHLVRSSLRSRSAIRRVDAPRLLGSMVRRHVPIANAMTMSWRYATAHSSGKWAVDMRLLVSPYASSALARDRVKDGHLET